MKLKSLRGRLNAFYLIFDVYTIRRVSRLARAVQRRVFRNKKPAPALFVGRMAIYAKQK